MCPLSDKPKYLHLEGFEACDEVLNVLERVNEGGRAADGVRAINVSKLIQMSTIPVMVLTVG